MSSKTPSSASDNRRPCDARGVVCRVYSPLLVVDARPGLWPRARVWRAPFTSRPSAPPGCSASLRSRRRTLRHWHHPAGGMASMLEDGRVLGGVVMHDAMQCRCAKSWSCALPAEAFYSLVGKTLVPLTSQTSKSLARVLPKPIKYRTTHVALSTEMRRRHADWLGPYTTKSDNRPITCEI